LYAINLGHTILTFHLLFYVFGRPNMFDIAHDSFQTREALCGIQTLETIADELALGAIDCLTASGEQWPYVC
jgi:hypothetical protein